MRFGYTYAFNPRRADDFVEIAQLCEQAGFSMLAAGDSPALTGELFSAMTLLAMNTSERVTVGALVSNPMMRHPQVAAGGLATVDAISGGRAFFALGPGDSAAFNIGRRPTTLSAVEDYIRVMRELLDHGEAIYGGEKVSLKWAKQRSAIWMAPGGPRGLRLAGKIADGIVVATGLTPELIDDAYRQVAAGAAEAGRDPRAIEMWWQATACIAPSREEAIDAMAGSLASAGMHLARYSRDGKYIPDDLWPRLKELHDRYDYMRHGEAPGKSGRGGNAHLTDELGLREFLASRQGILGTADDWIARIEALQAMGVQNLTFAALMPNKRAFIERMGRDIIPVFEPRSPAPPQFARASRDNDA